MTPSCGHFPFIRSRSRVLGRPPASSQKLTRRSYHDLGPGLGRDITTQIHIELARDLQVVGRPGIALRVRTGPRRRLPR